MNHSFLFILLTLINYVLTAPIPVPNAEPDVVIETYHAVTTVPVAEVIISDGATYTTQLTTLETEAETSTSPQVQTTSTPQNIVAQAAVIATTSSDVASVNPDCSTSISVDSNGVAHVILTVAQTVVVNGAGDAVTTYNGGAETSETTQVIETTPITSSTLETAYTTSSNIIPDTSSTIIPDTSSTIIPDTTSSSESLYVTTWANGEVFYSTLPTTLVSAINVAPVVAFTTVSANTLTSSATGLLSLVTSNGSVLLGTLTEGLTKDKNVANTMANPATIAVTNSLITTTAIPYSSSTSIISTSSTTSSSVSVDNNAVIGTAITSSGGVAVGFEQTTSSTSSIDSTTIETTSSTSTSSTAAATTTSSSSGYLTKVPYSIVYSPYEDDGSCKDYSSVLSDLQLIKSKGISELRVYGNDCNYLTTVLKVSKDIGLMVNQGFWISSAGVDSIDDAVTDLITYVSSGSGGYGWEIFSYFTIGNEAIISNYCTVDELISKISSVKSQLQSAGYTGKVTTSEPPVSFENNPSLCTSSEIDFVGINPHSYFDTSAYASDAGTFVSGQIDIVKGVCGDLDIVVTETGYPNAGDVNGNNVPSTENQLIAVQSILDVVGTDVTILTTFEDLWKSPGQYNIEQHFGIIQILQ